MVKLIFGIPLIVWGCILFVHSIPSEKMTNNDEYHKHGHQYNP